MPHPKMSFQSANDDRKKPWNSGTHVARDPAVEQDQHPYSTRPIPKYSAARAQVTRAQPSYASQLAQDFSAQPASQQRAGPPGSQLADSSWQHPGNRPTDFRSSHQPMSEAEQERLIMERQHLLRTGQGEAWTIDIHSKAKYAGLHPQRLLVDHELASGASVLSQKAHVLPGSAADRREHATHEIYGAVALVLLPREVKDAEAYDRAMESHIQENVPQNGHVLILGVAPPAPVILRILPGFTAERTRAAEAEGLRFRAKLIVQWAKLVRPDIKFETQIWDDNLPEGNDPVEHVVMDLCNRQTPVVSAIVIGRDEHPLPSVLAFTYHELIIRAAAHSRIPVFLLHETLDSTEARIAKEAAKRKGNAEHGRPLFIGVVDANDDHPSLPAHIAFAVSRLQAGDTFVLHSTVEPPAEGDTTKPEDRSALWAEMTNTAEARLNDTKNLVTRMLKLRNLKGAVNLDVMVNPKHFMPGISAAIQTLNPKCVALPTSFRRHKFLQDAKENVLGSEYERLVASYPDIDFIISAGPVGFC